MLVQLVWQIDRAIFRFSDPKGKTHWFQSARPVCFEFSPEQSDDNAESIMDSALSQDFDLTEQNSQLAIDVSDDEVCITARVTFYAELRDDVSRETFIEWAEDKGGWFCASIMLSDVDAYITDDSGGEFHWQE